MVGTWYETMIFDNTKDLPMPDVLGKIETYSNGKARLENIKIDKKRIIKNIEGVWKTIKDPLEILDKEKLVIELEGNEYDVKGLGLIPVDGYPRLFKLTVTKAEGNSVPTEIYFRGMSSRAAILKKKN